MGIESDVHWGYGPRQPWVHSKTHGLEVAWGLGHSFFGCWGLDQSFFGAESLVTVFDKHLLGVAGLKIGSQTPKMARVSFGFPLPSQKGSPFWLIFKVYPFWLVFKQDNRLVGSPRKDTSTCESQSNPKEVKVSVDSPHQWIRLSALWIDMALDGRFQ